MTRPDLTAVPSFYRGYIENVKDYDVMEAFRIGDDQTMNVLRAIPEDKGEFRYATGKWSIKELINHLIDVERIMAYRALRFARNDKTDLPGFEENDYAPEANAHARTIIQLCDELARLRVTTIDMFAAFTPEMLERKGTANKNPLSVLLLGYIISGHALHHVRVLKERYLTA